MWWFLLYYLALDVPSGLVETSFANGVLTVGDTVEYVGAFDLTCATKRGGTLIFTFEELNVFSF